MAYKPVHLITNDVDIQQKLEHYGFYNEETIIAEDRTPEGSRHWHLYFEYTVKEDGSLQPARKNFVGYARRRSGCTNCNESSSNYHCPVCGLYYKFIWPKNEAHTENIKEYIREKLSE